MAGKLISSAPTRSVTVTTGFLFHVSHTWTMRNPAKQNWTRIMRDHRRRSNEDETPEPRYFKPWMLHEKHEEWSILLRSYELVAGISFLNNKLAH